MLLPQPALGAMTDTLQALVMMKVTLTEAKRGKVDSNDHVVAHVIETADRKTVTGNRGGVDKSQ